MRDVLCVDGVEDPVEAEDWVEDHGQVVRPGDFVTANVTQETL